MQNLKSKFNTLKSHNRFWELIDLRKNALAKDSIYQKRLVSSRYIDNYNDIYSGANYEYNYNFDFELSKNDVRDLKSGRLTQKLLEKLENDLGMLESNSIYALDLQPISNSIDIYTNNDSFEVFNIFPELYEDIKMLNRGSFILFMLFVLSILKNVIVRTKDQLFQSEVLKSIFLIWVTKIKPKKSIVS